MISIFRKEMEWFWILGRAGSKGFSISVFFLGKLRFRV